MKQYHIVAILLVFFNSCSEEKVKPIELPISSLNSEAISFFNKAEIHRENLEFDEANKNYRLALDLDPNFILALINKEDNGIINYRTIDLSNKNTDFLETIISQGTDYEKILFEMYKIPYRASDSVLTNKRLKLAQKLVDLYPNLVAPLNILQAQLSPSLSDSNKDFLIIKRNTILKAIELFPKSHVAYEALLSLDFGGAGYSSKFRSDPGFYQLFESKAEDFLSKFPNSPLILRKAANIYRNSYDYIDQNRYKKSLDLYDKLLSILEAKNSSFYGPVLKFKADLLLNVGQKIQSYSTMKLAIDSSSSVAQKIESYFQLFVLYIAGGDYIDAIKEINTFDQKLDDGFFDSDGNEIIESLWLKSKVSLNLYKAIIYAHANQYDRANNSLKDYKDYAFKTIEYFEIKNINDFQKYYTQNDLPKANVKWNTIHPQALSFYEAWVAVLTGNDERYNLIIKNITNGSVLKGIYNVMKGNYERGIEILSKSGNQFNSSQFNRYFRAQALIGLGRIDEAKSTLNYLRYMPYINFDAAFVKYRAAKLYESM